MSKVSRNEALTAAEWSKTTEDLRVYFGAMSTKLVILEFRGRYNGGTTTASFNEAAKVVDEQGETGRYFARYESTEMVGDIIRMSLSDPREFLVVWNTLDLRWDISGHREFDTHTLGLVPVEELIPEHMELPGDKSKLFGKG